MGAVRQRSGGHGEEEGAEHPAARQVRLRSHCARTTHSQFFSPLVRYLCCSSVGRLPWFVVANHILSMLARTHFTGSSCVDARYCIRFTSRGFAILPLQSLRTCVQ